MGSRQRFNWLKILILSSLGVITALSCFEATPAKAETKSFGFTLNSAGNQSFLALMQQAESLVSNLIQQEFAQPTNVTQLAIMVVGERNGQEVPLLLSSVSRSEWQTEPQIHRWTKYFSASEVLLGFNKLQPSSSTLSTFKGSVIPRAARMGKRDHQDDPGFRDD